MQMLRRKEGGPIDAENTTCSFLCEELPRKRGWLISNRIAPIRNSGDGKVGVTHEQSSDVLVLPSECCSKNPLTSASIAV